MNMESELTSPATRRNLHPAEIDCKWWKQGYCHRGSTCYFRHNPVLAGSDKSKNKVNQVKIAQSDSQEQCAICLDTPKVFGLLVNCDHVFCLECIRGWRASAKRTSSSDRIDSRGNSNRLKTASKTCPVCRTYSDFVVPSIVFLPSLPTIETPPESRADTGKVSGSEGSGAKQEMINDYLNCLKRIPCRYFEESVKQGDSSTFNPICRFGNDCHYAHLHPLTGQPHIFSSTELDTIKKKRTLDRRRARQSAERAMAAQYMMLRMAALDLGTSDDDEVPDDDDEDDGWSSDQLLDPHYL
jgi:E3 ubiquitin-protein ligase makorin